MYRLHEIFFIFLRLGLTSFGGPTAHIAFFREEFVVRRASLTDEEYGQLVALAQFIPGPSSSQVGMSIGYRLGGVRGAALAFIAFTLPSAAIMTTAGLSVIFFDELISDFLLAKLTLFALAVVSYATLGMARSFCKTKLQLAIALTATLVLLLMPSLFTPVSVLVLAGLVCTRVGLALPGDQNPKSNTACGPHTSKPVGLISLILFLALLLLSFYPLSDQTTTIQLLAGVYRAGALVFGGGHVVLPLLEHVSVTPGLISFEQFMAGYGLAQAIPGPVFTFGAFLGGSVSGSVAGALFALLALFLPGILILFGMLPLWDQISAQPAMRRALVGVNAAVVGLMISALIYPLIPAAIHSVQDSLIAATMLAVLHWGRIPIWLWVLAIVGMAALVG